MRIAMVSEHVGPLTDLGEFDAGGPNLHVRELSAALCRLGHEVTVYTRRDTADGAERTRSRQGYDVVRIPTGPPMSISKEGTLPHVGRFATALKKTWTDDRPDVVHSHFWMSGLAALLAVKAFTVPLVHTFHALGTVKRRYLGAADTSPAERIRIERMIGRRAARIVATCSDEVQELVRMGVPRAGISIIPSGVDIGKFVPDGPSEVKRLPRRIVTVGRLVPRNGFRTVIGALPGMPDTELVIAGGPPKGKLAEDAEAQQLLRCARAAGVGDRVRLTGQLSRSATPALLRSADLVACVPWYEPFGTVSLEAMACGVPVVASAVGGLIDTVVDGVTGLHVPPQRLPRLAAAARSLMDNDVACSSFGLAGRDRVQARYSWDRIALDTVRAYGRTATSPTLSAARKW